MKQKLLTSGDRLNRFAFWIYMLISQTVTFLAYVISAYFTNKPVDVPTMSLLMVACFVSSAFLLFVSGEYKGVLRGYDLSRIIKAVLLTLIKEMALFLTIVTYVNIYVGNVYYDLIGLALLLDIVLSSVFGIMARKSIIRLYKKYKIKRKVVGKS